MLLIIFFKQVSVASLKNKQSPQKIIWFVLSSVSYWLLESYTQLN